ncbi:MAG: META domain-containing protein, partial [Litorilinea sp.]
TLYEGGPMNYMTHLSRWLLVSAMLILLAACSIPEIEIPSAPSATTEAEDAQAETRTLYVGPELVECTGVGPMECMQVRESADAPYENFFDSIEGFDFVPGYAYELRVAVEEVEDPPADASSLRYTLVEVVSQTAVAGFPLEGTVWNLLAYIDGDGTRQSALAQSEGFILLENGEMGGSAGCNSFFGDYVIEDESLTIGPLGSTLMACEEPLMRQESAVLAALEATATYRIVGGILTLHDADGTEVAIFGEGDSQAPDPQDATEDADAEAGTGDIEDIRWELSEYAVDGELQAAVADGEAFLLLSGGDVTGHTGCNQFGGGRAYLLEGTSLRLGEMISTLMACMGPVSDQEQAVFAALEATRSYTVVEDTLTLLDEANAPVLVFVAGAQEETMDEEVTDDANTDNATTEGADAPIAPAPSLEDYLWNLGEYRNRAGELTAPIAPGELELTAGTIYGRTGCNTLNGPYTTAGDGLSFGAIATTRMGCAPDIAAQEFDVLQALRQVADYTLAADTLTFVDGAGAPVLILVTP